MFLTEKVFMNGNQNVLNRFSTSGLKPPGLVLDNLPRLRLGKIIKNQTSKNQEPEPDVQKKKPRHFHAYLLADPRLLSQLGTCVTTRVQLRPTFCVMYQADPFPIDRSHPVYYAIDSEKGQRCSMRS